MTQDDEIEQQYVDQMRKLASIIDAYFNGPKKGKQRKTAFVLLIAPFGDTDGRVNYVSNGDRKDVTTMMREVIARFEGQAEMKGRA